jgi:hypothetical protein
MSLSGYKWLPPAYLVRDPWLLEADLYLSSFCEHFQTCSGSAGLTFDFDM